MKRKGPISVRLSPDTLRIIDGFVTKYKANRSQFITAVVEAAAEAIEQHGEQRQQDSSGHPGSPDGSA